MIYRLVHMSLNLLPTNLLVKIAQRTMHARPLIPYPNWTFGKIEKLDFVSKVRLAIVDILEKRSFSQTIPFYWVNGLLFNADLNNEIGRCLYLSGCFEPNECAFLAKLLRPGMVFVDAGANEGMFTLLAAKADAHVLAFEPSNRERERLKANLNINQLENVEVLPYALYDHPGEAQLTLAQERYAGHNTLGNLRDTSISVAGHQAVALCRLDEIVDERNIGHVDLIKMDIEGAEYAALHGGVRLIERDHPTMVIEFNEEALHAQGTSITELGDWLRRLGYVLYSFDPATGTPVKNLPGTAFLSDNVIAAFSPTIF